jgi:hypothetical protein
MRLVTFFAFGLIAQTGLAFTLNGGTVATKGWSNPSVQFHLNPANCPANVASLLEKAFDVWNSVPTTSLKVSKGSDSSVTIDQVLSGTIDVTPSIHCVTDMASIGLNADVIPGVAMGASYDGSGNIATGALVLNVQDGAGANINTYDSDVTINVIAHEIGHVLGLGHSASHAALMYYDASERTQASLSQDDVDGITYLYSRNEFGSDPMFGGCAVIGANVSNSGGWLILVALALPVMASALTLGNRARLFRH